MRVRSLTALLVFTCAASVGPSRAHAADDLMQVWRTALGSDPVYAAARQLPRQPGKEPQARAGLLPQISAEAGGACETRSTQGFSMAYSGGRGTWDLALTQPLFNWSRWQAYEQSKLLTADAEVRLQQAFQDLLLRVAEAYFNVLYAQDALTATEAEKAAVAGQLESAKRNFELGNATITDTYEAQARYDLVLAQELRLQNDLDVRRDVLAQILGSPAGALAELPPGVRLPSPQPARLNDWSTQAEASSLDVLRAQLQTRIAGRDIQIARAATTPP